MFPFSLPRFPVILGVKGPELTKREEDFVKSYPPIGFILFSRNCHSVAQVKELCGALTDLLGLDRIPILIDEEGGKVSRLSALGEQYKTSSVSIFQDAKDPKELCYQHYAKISRWLNELGITVNCAPVLDVIYPKKTAQFLVSRCFSSHAEKVAELGGIAVQAMQDHGIIPVIKHLPGHGRAEEDSHFSLPTIPDAINDLASDFFPFQHVKAPWGMTSHLYFPALDPKEPVTFSEAIIKKTIREVIGFKGFLVTDDLYMHAITGTPLKTRVEKALAAGHDAVLLCHEGPETWEEAVRDLAPLLKRSF